MKVTWGQILHSELNWSILAMLHSNNPIWYTALALVSTTHLAACDFRLISKARAVEISFFCEISNQLPGYEAVFAYSLFCRSREVDYHNLLFAKAFPEWDFRYFSNDSALDRSLKAIYVINSQGLYFDVWGDWPWLCAVRRVFKSSVKPT